jgi:excinuclease ABC subunit C
MVTRAKSLSWQETDSVLEAIILESLLIRRYQPFYNVDDRDDKSDQYVVITDEPWPRVFLVRARDFHAMKKDGRLPYEVKVMFGPYVYSGLIKEALKVLRRMFPFRDVKAHDPRHEAFYRALGRSPEGADLKDSHSGGNQREEENARRRYARTIAYLTMFFQGKKKQLRARLEKEMHAHARKMEFEEADQVKRLLYAIDHIHDMALIKEQENSFKSTDNNSTHPGRPGRTSPDFRIEAYDIAHLSGTNVVGSMTVSVNGESAPSEYRKFNISRQENNDIAGLVEILSRRLNHSEWPYPDIIVVDGNENQLKAAQAVLSARRMVIPVVAVTKDEHHKADHILGDADLTSRYRKEIIAVNAEAHRFAIAFHRRKMRRNLL